MLMGSADGQLARLEFGPNAVFVILISGPLQDTYNWQ